MLMRSTALSFALLWATSGLALPASAEAEEGVAKALAEVTKSGSQVPDSAAIVTEFATIKVDGATVELRARGLGTDAVEFDAAPIFEKMRSRFETRGSILGYWRFQDGAVMGLDFADGKLRANGVVLGKIPNFPTRETADTWLSPNAIAVLTGTKAAFDAGAGWTFTLDERLKPRFDLDVWVNGAPISAEPGFEARTVGPVLLVPLKPVAAALGHKLVEDQAAGTVTLTRVHDSAVISLELNTGLVTVNGVPSGVTPNIAFAEKNGLVLPFSAVETLTGTHVVLAPGSSRIEITLDDRLSSLALPGDRIVDTAAVTPFTAERLDWQVSDRGPLKADFYSHFRGYNAVATIETAGGFDTAAGLSPRWMSVDIAALEGWRGTVGDYAGNFREFTGTSTSRVRGIAYRTKMSNGAILAIAAGLPVSGAKPLANGASSPEFGGFSAGARVIAANDQREAGVAMEVSADGQSARLVAGGRQTFEVPQKDDKGLESAYVSADAGVFKTGDESSFDVRVRAEARYRVSPNISLAATGAHDGAGFQSEISSNSTASSLTTGSRSTLSGSADWHALKPAVGVHNLAVGLRASATHAGGPNPATSFTQQAAISGRIGATGPDLSLDAGFSQADSDKGPVGARNFAARLWHTFDWLGVSAAYTHNQTDGAPDDRRFVVNTTLPVWQKRFEKGASASLAPTASYVWSPAGNDFRVGAALSGDTGHALGERFRLNGQFTSLTRADATGQGADIFANAGASWRIGNLMALQAVYSTDFAERSDVSIALRGSVVFNEPRRHTAPKDGAGVLKGRVFLDMNRDGLRQADEPGIGGVRISVMSTALSLRADGLGSYTIQNLPAGLYTLSIDRRSLPLGFLIAESEAPRATIGEGRVTTLDIPVIASGQIRGAVFSDDNGNGTVDAGEARLEGEWVKLIPEGDDIDKDEIRSLQSAAFGQFGFENVMPGRYRLEVKRGRETVSFPVELTEEALFAEHNIAMPNQAAEAEPIADLLAAP